MHAWLDRVGELWRGKHALPATIVLVGCEHSLQSRTGLGIGDAEIERGQKHHFAHMLEGLISRHSIDLIAEETRAGEETIALRLADAHACEYVNINAVKRRCCMIQLRREWGRFSNFSFRTPQRRISAYPARPSG